MDKLEKIFEMQAELQEQKMGGHPGLMKDETRIQFAKDMILAAEDELHEALGEIGWKPWATSRHFNNEAFRGELVDLLHFFVNLCLVSGTSAEMLFEGYQKKNAKNHKRQEEGYDGVTGKCPGCSRALDDDAVTCFLQAGVDGGIDKIWCRMQGKWFLTG